MPDKCGRGPINCELYLDVKDAFVFVRMRTHELVGCCALSPLNVSQSDVPIGEAQNLNRFTFRTRRLRSIRFYIAVSMLSYLFIVWTIVHITL